MSQDGSNARSKDSAHADAYVGAPAPSTHGLGHSLSPSADPRPQAALAATLDGSLGDEGEEAGLDCTMAGGEFSRVSAQHAILDPFPVRDWDRYEFLRVLGRGGMGAVYLARDRRLGRPVALKFIRSDDDRMVARFLQEARAQSRLSHPNICKIYETGEVEGKAYIAMEFVEGRSLDKVGRDLPLLEKVQLIRDVASALHSAHELGIIHRDIKPANIMLESSSSSSQSGQVGPRAVLMDFGLARESGEGQGLTESGAVMGTPAYMSPEQARGDVRHIDRRSDVYGLGAALYDLLLGQPPFVGDSTVRIILQVLSVDPPSPRLRDATIPEALELIVLKCLNKEPHQRYATAAELAADLDRILQRQRVRARRLSLWSQLYWKGRRNRPLAAAVIALSCLLLGFVGYGIRTAVQGARREALALQRAALAQRLGQAIQDLEWLVRTAQLLPLHDIGPDRALVRARMAEIQGEMRSFGALAAGLDHYALGRGHVALHEWDAAQRELVAAEAAGIDEPGLHFALGRVLGERYSTALADARKGGDRSYFERRKREIDAEHLPAVLRHLQRSREQKTASASFIEALLDFYQQRYPAALLHAQFAARSTPWLYEALRLQGDVHLTQALSARDHGDTDGAERSFAQAVRAYEQAADIGRSDASLHEAIAEVWIRQEEMDMYRGKDPRPALDRALAAADRALAADPQGSHAYTKKAFGYAFLARYLASHGASYTEFSKVVENQIHCGKLAIQRNQGDAATFEITGMGYQALAEQQMDQGISVQPLADRAIELLRRAIALEKDSPWIQNDYGLSLATKAVDQRNRGGDPEEVLKQSIAAFRRATTLDSGYALAYSNMSAWQIELADWMSSKERSPIALLQDAISNAEMSIKINAKNPLPYGNSGQAYLKLAAWYQHVNVDGRDAALQASRQLQRLLALDPSLTAARKDLAAAFTLLAWHQRRLGQDASTALRQAQALD